jgi:hypothetical protein
MNTTPKRWWQVYNGDGECRVFKEMARGVHDWHTTTGLAKATKLTPEKIEAIIAKYLPLGIIQQHPKEPDKWCYWERGRKKE